jgi:hypothetical protein
MKTAHVVLGLVFAGAIAGCGSSSGSGSGDGGGGSGGTGGGNMCTPTPAGTSCTQAELNAYSNCLQNACNSQYVTCFGPSYKQGVPGGTCSSYAQCQNACGCTDAACRNACTVPAACMTCLSTIATCSLGANCTIPPCALGDASIPTFDGNIPGLDGGFPFDAGNATCADLTSCCNAITEANTKMACQQVVATGQNQVCSASLGTFRSAGLCP